MKELLFQHTAARRRLRLQGFTKAQAIKVSTHSRAEAAAIAIYFYTVFLTCFNTQPRGGGCVNSLVGKIKITLVSTHSRAEAAALAFTAHKYLFKSFNTQPRGGGCYNPRTKSSGISSFNTQPRGGGC